MDIEKHGENTVKLSLKMGRQLKLDAVEICELHVAAENHDIGKKLIPKNILYKPSSLTEEEFLIIKEHPVLGAELLKKKHYRTKITDAVLFHHERFDGNGYPFGIKGNDIPLYSRIISVADAFDAMTSKRIYKTNILSQSEAIEEIVRNSGNQFDPEIVKLFLLNFKEIFL